MLPTVISSLTSCGIGVLVALMGPGLDKDGEISALNIFKSVCYF